MAVTDDAFAPRVSETRMSPLLKLSMSRLPLAPARPRGSPSFAPAGCSEMRGLKCARAFPCSPAPR
eukprot:867090-Pyramimonas_sp.AAC.1